ncbi:MAG: hypothetical protein WCV67_02150 [Victivallaceae bacterium]|jgi:hypothetical protein
MNNKKIICAVSLAGLICMLTGCTSPGGLAPSTMPISSKDSYTVIQRDAYAIDSSVAILMIFPVTTCSAYDAMQKAKAKYKADALINVTAENIYNPYFFYSVQKIVVRGDAIKFKKSGNLLE